MRIPKRYGSYRVDKCPFCGKQAVTQNEQKIPVCVKHKDEELKDIKCQCGEWLDLLSGKYGPYFRCMRCGNVSWARAMELNDIAPEKKEKPAKKPIEKEEKTITSDDVDIYFS